MKSIGGTSMKSIVLLLKMPGAHYRVLIIKGKRIGARSSDDIQLCVMHFSHGTVGLHKNGFKHYR